MAIGAKDNRILNGKPLSALIAFSVPIIFGNVFQQLYNIADAVIAGRYLGDNPLGAISVTAPFTDIFYALMIGSTVGAGVLLARLFGGNELGKMKKIHSSALSAGLVFTGVLMVFGFVFSKGILRSQGNGEIIVEEAMKYLNILFFGLPFCFLYNYYAALLRSCGNSRVPFFVLLVSCILNVFLDLLFIAVIKNGIEGVAAATVICQVFSAVCCIIETRKRYDFLRLKPSEIKIDFSQLKAILSYAWGSATQQAVVCTGRMIVQGLLTGLGSLTVTGYNMSLRAEGFVFCFSSGISAGAVVCISQNLGADNTRRIKSFFKTAICVELTAAAVVSVIFFLFPEKILSIFSNNETVISAGVLYLSTMAPAYFFAFLSEITQGFFRGLGRIRLTMCFSIMQVVLRVVLSFILVPKIGIKGICISVFSGWLLMALIEGSYGIYKVNKMKPREAK